jgi:hypothetical protein
MPRHPAIIPTKRVHTRIREDLMVKVDLLLYSPLEGKIPFGAYQNFFTELVVEYFERLNKGAEK